MKRRKPSAHVAQRPQSYYAALARHGTEEAILNGSTRGGAEEENPIRSDDPTGRRPERVGACHGRPVASRFRSWRCAGDALRAGPARTTRGRHRRHRSHHADNSTERVAAMDQAQSRAPRKYKWELYFPISRPGGKLTRQKMMRNQTHTPEIDAKPNSSHTDSL